MVDPLPPSYFILASGIFLSSAACVRSKFRFRLFRIVADNRILDVTFNAATDILFDWYYVREFRVHGSQDGCLPKRYQSCEKRTFAIDDLQMLHRTLVINFVFFKTTLTKIDMICKWCIIKA